MFISSHFDGGSIEVLECQSAPDIFLKLRSDTNCDFMQWFYFRLAGARDRDCRLQFLNASSATYPLGFQNYRAVASYDGQNWFRVNTTYNGQVMAIHHKPLHDSIFFAYFAPFSLERHLHLIGQAQKFSHVRHEVLGQTVQGRDIDLLIVGDEDRAAMRIWVIARQHPGETMAEWFMQGMIERLTDLSDSVSKSLLQPAVFYMVPNMNPDGAFHGNLRANFAGKNLNREWLEPNMDNSPEVFLVRQKMMSTGVDLFLDIHGDEGLPYCFFAGSEGTPGYSQRICELESEFSYHLEKICPDFQTTEGYEKSKPGEGNLSMATNWVAEHFGCLSLTLEMPFKDNLNLPDSVNGWSPQRSIKLGQAMLQPIAMTLGKLR
ncbi:MAG: carboxypeptidase family protein [Candidatus Cloacimonetes bacterium]|nr:carboxypeptidase family protein [Candidatus Cloacimonadota bacterium]